MLSIRASLFSRYLLEKTGIPDRDKNARLNPVKLIKYSRFRAFLALFKRRELRCPVLSIILNSAVKEEEKGADTQKPKVIVSTCTLFQTRNCRR